jgi:hypothetical protein
MSEFMTFAEARVGVENLLASDDPTAAVAELMEGARSVNVFKVAQYGLLVPIISTGLTGFLDTPLTERPPTPDSPNYIDPSNLIGMEVAKRAVEAYEDTTPDTREIIDDIAKKREQAGEFITTSVPRILEDGANFSADSMVTTANLNSMVIARAVPQLPNRQTAYQRAIRASTQPALARAVVHAVSNQAVGAAFANQLSTEVHVRPHRVDPVVAYHFTGRHTVLTKPLHRLPGLDHLGRSMPAQSVRVGCPLSFDPELLMAYYERVVDEVALTCGWPQTVS